jgi:hypothetical protein
MATPTKEQIAVQLQRLRQTGFDLKFALQAGANGFAPEFFFAIASRETNCVNELGDIRSDGPHGVGIVQMTSSTLSPSKHAMTEAGGPTRTRSSPSGPSCWQATFTRL